MKNFLIILPYIINLFFINLLSVEPLFSQQVNCNSNVWKNKPFCLKKQKKILEAKECVLTKNNLKIKSFQGTNLFK